MYSNSPSGVASNNVGEATLATDVLAVGRYKRHFLAQIAPELGEILVLFGRVNIHCNRQYTSVSD